MNEIVTVAGYMLTQAIDTIERKGFLNPFFSGFDKDDKLVTFTCTDISLELSIPKIIRKFESNEKNLKCAAIAYPAEIEDAYGNRESVIIVMVQNYTTDEYLMIFQPYERKDGKLEVYKYELLNFSPKLVDKLDEMEECFIQGALKYDDANHIWSERF